MSLRAIHAIALIIVMYAALVCGVVVGGLPSLLIAAYWWIRGWAPADRGMWGAATQACALVGAAAGVWIGAHRVELEELGGTRLRLTLSGWSGVLVGGFIGRVVASLWGQRLLDVMHVHAGGATVTDIELVIVLVAYGCATLVGAVAKERRVVA